MAITRGQTSGGEVISSSPVTLTWATAPAAGAKCIVLIMTDSSVTVSVVDNGTTPSTFTKDFEYNGGGGDLFVYRADGISLPATGSYNATITVVGSTDVVAAGRTYEGVATGAPSATNDATGTSASVATGNVTPTATGALLVGGFGCDLNSTDASITLTTSGGSTLYNSVSDTVAFVGALADNIATTTSAQGLAWTVGASSDYGAFVATYPAASSSNPITAGAVALSTMKPAGSLHNPVNLSAGALLLSAMKPAGSLHGGTLVAAGALGLAAMKPGGTLRNPVNLSDGSLSLAAMQPAGSVANEGLSNSLSAGALALSRLGVSGALVSGRLLSAGGAALGAMAVAGLVRSPFALSAGALALPAMKPAGSLVNPLNVSGGSLALSGMAVAGRLKVPVGLSGGLSLGSMATAGFLLSGGESLLINGQDIMACARAFAADLSGTLFVPLVRTADIAVPGKQGLVSVARKLYDRAQIPMTIWVRGMNADGNYPAQDQRDVVFYQNLDTLMQMFAVSGYVTLTHTTPAGTIREITGQVLQAFAPVRYAWSSQSTGNLAVIIECTGVFWREPFTVTSTIAGSSSPVAGQLAGQDGSTAPIEDAVITFYGPCVAPTLACGDWWVTYDDTLDDGQSVTIDVGNWAVTSDGLTVDYAKLLHAGLGPWIIFPPAPPGTGGPAVTYSWEDGGSGSSCAVTAQRAFLGG